MTTQKRALRILAVLVVIVGIVIAHIWFGLFSSPEYYKGFNWNTDKKKLEWRLSKAHYWYDEEEFKMNATKLDEDTSIWFRDSYSINKETGKLKEVRLLYLTEDSAKMEQIYEAEVKKLNRKLGPGTEGESYDELFTEWRGKNSIIRVIKNDFAFDDSNTEVEVVYQNRREYNEPYFTETHLWQSVYEKMIEQFYCISTPDYNTEAIKARKDPDFSDYKLRPSDETKKVIALINKHLFTGSDKRTEFARLTASSRGITESHPLTVDWFMDHPAKTMGILKELTREDDFLKSRSDVDKAYDRLTDEEKRKS